jgi:hypothetical protein
VAERLAAEALELFLELPRFGFGAPGAPETSRQPVMRLTGVVNPALDVLGRTGGLRAQPPGP